MLIGVCVPRLLARMSRIPASSSTARTPPPAMTPVPSLAGRSRTRAASNRPRTSCVIVVLCFGTVKRFFFASSTAISETESSLAGAVGQRLHASVVEVAAAVEDGALDARLLRVLRQQLADLGGLLALRAL